MSNYQISSDPNYFLNWLTINDTIMGGSSQATCKNTSTGLCFDGTLIERDGGFVSCLSPILSPPLDLSEFQGIVLDIEGEGRTLKFALSSGDKISTISKIFSGGVKWVREFKTNEFGVTNIRIPFDTLQPTIRAKPVSLPLKFNSGMIIQFQLLCSKFGIAGDFSSDFRPGPFCITLHSISAYV